MQIPAASSSSPWSSIGLPGKPETPEDEDKAVAAALPVAAEDDVVAVQPIDAEGLAALEAGQNKAFEPPSEVFAEIWKNGMKIGAVYTDGKAELSGAYGGTSLGNGAMYAQARAEALSRQVGGEVRYVDVAALQVAQVRSQLRSAYGV